MRNSSVDQLFWMDDGNGCYRTSLRWSLLGTHTGSGVFGEPTGVRCRVWGITQHHIRDGQFVEEWTYTNELAILSASGWPATAPSSNCIGETVR